MHPLTSEKWRPWRVVCGTSLVSGLAQVAILRELSAVHAVTSLSLAIRLMVGAVLVAHGLGAAVAAWPRLVNNRRWFPWLGIALSLYLLLLLAGTLRWLEPGLNVGVARPAALCIVGALAGVPFLAFGLVTALVTAEVQRDAPEQMGWFIAVSIGGAACGVVIAHGYSIAVGVNSLMVVAAIGSAVVLSDRIPAFVAGAVAAVAIALLPAESALERQRVARPGFGAPVTQANTELLYSGWSPFQKVDIYRFAEEVLIGCHNGIWQWWVAPRTDHPHAFPGYRQLYDPEWIGGRDVLVIGSGAGMGLLYLEQSRPKSITAVELDPLVADLGSNRFAASNAGIYTRVPMHVIEGRTFLDSTDQTFDVIIYEGSFLTTGHARVAVSTENYLYTHEGIERALDRLRPGGLGIVMYAGPAVALPRIHASLAHHELATAGLVLRNPGTLWRTLRVFLFARERSVVERTTRSIDRHANVERSPSLADAPPGIETELTDTRPFLYAPAWAGLWPLALLAGIGLAGMAFAGALPGRRRLRLYFFCIGVAYMLLQYWALSRFRAWLGDPVTTSYTVLFVLLAAMGWGAARARWFVALSRSRRALWTLAALGWAALLLWQLPFSWGLAPWIARAMFTVVAVAPLGFVMGVFFPVGFRQQPAEAIPGALLMDALGSIVGFFGFHLIALVGGLPSTAVVGAALYALAWSVRPRA